MNYFLNGSPNPSNPSPLQWWGSLTAALFMSGYEAIMLGVLTTPIAWHYVVRIPNFIKRFPNREGQKIIRFVGVFFLMLAVILLTVVYYMDWSTTYGGLGMSEEVVASFLATCLVIGSEVLFIGGNICAWLAFLGEKEELEAKKEIEAGDYELAQFNGSSHAPSEHKPRTPRR